MMAWLAANIWTIVISIILLVIVALIIWRLIKNKKEGKSSCGCGCDNCAMSGNCHQKK
ncbi:MAG: FeoB-associated Cys-rich membrane protein [Lachnospiraceae bacterium]|nr:FeoB-associated Cys-rich membrane protein [Lachnospiraceae bacterium]